MTIGNGGNDIVSPEIISLLRIEDIEDKEGIYLEKKLDINDAVITLIKELGDFSTTFRFKDDAGDENLYLYAGLSQSSLADVFSFNAFWKLTKLGKIGYFREIPQALLDLTPDTISTDSFSRPFPTLTTAQRLALTGLVPGAGVYDSDEKNLRLFDGTEQKTAFSPATVNVYSINDLPAPVGGVITLADNTIYKFPRGETINLTDTLKFGLRTELKEAYIVTDSPFEFSTSPFLTSILIDDCFITYTGTGTLFDTADIGIQFIIFNRVGLSAATGKLFDLSSSDPSSLVLCNSTAVYVCNDIGILTGMGVDLSDTRIFNFGNGLQLINNYQGINFSTVQIQQGQNLSTRMFDISGTSEQISITDLFAKPKSNEKVFYFNPALNFVSIVVANSPISLDESGVDETNIFDTGSLTQKSPKAKFTGNVNIPNSKSSIEATMETLTPLTTDIPAQNAWVLVNVTGVTYDYDERIVEFSTGLSQFKMIELTTLKADGDITLDPLNATKTLAIRFCCILVDDYLITFDNTTDRVLETGTARVNGDNISFRNTVGTLPAELRKDIIYYVVNRTVNDFQLSYTEGGPAINFTDNGTPPNYYSIASFHGLASEISVSAGTPLTVQTKGTMEVIANVLLGIVVQNKTDAVNVRVHKFYKRI